MENQTPEQTESATHPKPDDKQHKSSFFEKYGSKKWLLPLLGFLGILILSLGVYGVMDSQNENSTSKLSREERREQRKERKENRKDKKNNKNKKEKKDRKNVKADANAGWTNFSYSYANYQIRMKYPGDLKVNITDGKSKTVPQAASSVVTFTGDLHNIQMTFEPNSLPTLAAWHEQLKKTNTIYTRPTETITVAGRQSLIQQTLGTTANMHAFIPVDSKTVLWINMNYGGSDEDAKALLTEMLDSLSFGSKPIGPLPTAIQ